MISSEKLKEMRTRRKLSQGQLGKLIGTSQPNIYKLEHGIQPDIRTSTLIKLADALHCTTDELLDRPQQTPVAV